tara:strand:+ start:3619 stop:3798 length:180 start_codon:yes stop_codon:yes gene_type:complete
MTAWTHHDPAVRRLIREAQAVAWDEGYVTADREWQSSEYSDPDAWPSDLSRNPYRKETQ